MIYCFSNNPVRTGDIFDKNTKLRSEFWPNFSMACGIPSDSDYANSPMAIYFPRNLSIKN